MSANPSVPSLCQKSSSFPFPLETSTSDTFHISPLFILDHRTISSHGQPFWHGYSSVQPGTGASPIHNLEQLQASCDHSPSPGQGDHLDSKSQDNSFEPPDEDNPLHDSDAIRSKIPMPCNSREAYLLLETARADRSILLARQTLADQIIHRNVLVLQYNRMLLEKTQDDLRAADRFIGHVRLMIRKSGQTAAFEYAMAETPTLNMSEKSSHHHPSFDIDLT